MNVELDIRQEQLEAAASHTVAEVVAQWGGGRHGGLSEELARNGFPRVGQGNPRLLTPDDVWGVAAVCWLVGNSAGGHAATALRRTRRAMVALARRPERDSLALCGADGAAWWATTPDSLRFGEAVVTVIPTADFLAIEQRLAVAS